MTSELKSSAGRRDLSGHILSASVVMIGVSTTLIGLVKVAKAHIRPTRVDQYAGVVSCSSLSVRSPRTCPSVSCTDLSLVRDASGWRTKRMSASGPLADMVASPADAAAPDRDQPRFAIGGQTPINSASTADGNRRSANAWMSNDGFHEKIGAKRQFSA